MKILVLGAGGIGGYFGGMAAKAGKDVTFLVREPRARLLKQRGLVIETPSRTLSVVPKLYTSNAVAQHFDLVLLSCKAYDLNSALDTIEPMIAPDTLILPLLNGLQHYETLDGRFGPERILGGFCQIGVTMTVEGTIRRMSESASIVLGQRSQTFSTVHVNKIALALANEEAKTTVSTDITRDAWEKFCFLGTLAAGTCLLRGTIAEIQATSRGKSVLGAIFDEVCAIAGAAGFPQDQRFVDERRRILATDGAPMSSSMYRDLLAGNRVESEQILGDLARRAESSAICAPYLIAAHCQLQLYEATRLATGRDYRA